MGTVLSSVSHATPRSPRRRMETSGFGRLEVISDCGTEGFVERRMWESRVRVRDETRSFSGKNFTGMYRGTHWIGKAFTIYSVIFLLA